MIGKKIYELAYKLWPLNRSLTGEGNRETLKLISEHIPNLKIKSVSSGKKVLDWTVPKEWVVNEAYIETPNGKKICDFKKNNLHLVGYSIPFNGVLPLNKLKEYIHTLPDQPNAIPYVTSYYQEKWGFCLSKNELDLLEEGNYKVKVDTKLFDGQMNYAEIILPGRSSNEVFLSSYICHPSMANNEISGPTVLTYLTKWLQDLENREFTYRIIFIPETIGSITYLSQNLDSMKKNIIAGFNLSCLGDDRSYSYLPSRNGKTISDEVAKHVLKWTDPNFIKYTWLDRGSDERQYCAPGIDLPIASIFRTKHGAYPEYHTSLDNLKDVVTPKGLDGGYWVIRKALELLEKNKKYETTVLGEPKFQKRNLTKEKLMSDFISLCDGKTSLLDISNILNVPSWELYNLVNELKSLELIKEVN
jgi:aminopeptidase-like protein